MGMFRMDMCVIRYRWVCSEVFLPLEWRECSSEKYELLASGLLYIQNAVFANENQNNIINHRFVEQQINNTINCWTSRMTIQYSTTNTLVDMLCTWGVGNRLAMHGLIKDVETQSDIEIDRLK